MEHNEKLELMRSEVHRLLKECQDSNVVWGEMAASVHLDPRLDLESQVNVYAQVFQELEEDVIERYEINEYNEYEYVKTYGVNMG